MLMIGFVKYYNKKPYAYTKSRLNASRLHSVNFNPIGLRMVPKDEEFFEVEHSTFRYQNFFFIFRESAENRFPGKFHNFEFLHFNPLYDFFGGKKGPCFRIIRIQVVGNYLAAGIYRETTGRNFLLNFCKFGFNKGFRGC